jgi:hypothetical protein
MNAIVVPAAYLARMNYKRVDTKAMQRWFVLASMWNRYGGSAETAMDQDLRALSEDKPFELLIHDLRQAAGRLDVSPEDLDDAGVRSSFFLPMYLASRLQGAVDWFYNVKLSSTNLGTDHALELHHIFPRAVVKDLYPKQDVNELANIAFLSKKPNIEIGAKTPGDYLATIPEERLRQQFIPLDRSLWEVERFQDFLAARRELLANGINNFLRSLE